MQINISENYWNMFVEGALEYYELINTEVDTLTFGEFTRRYERAIKQLEELL